MHIDRDRLYCYLDGKWLNTLLQDDRILDGLIEGLRVPGKAPHLRAKQPGEKLALIEAQIEHLRGMRSSLWHGVEAADVLAAHLYRLNMSKVARATMFSAVKREDDLAAPIVRWLEQQGLQAHEQVATGTRIPDVVGHRAAGWLSSEHVVAVELKNDVQQLKRGLDQMTTFDEYAHEVYLACTPAMAAAYLDKHANAPTVRRWDPRILESKLERFGFGLLLVSNTLGASNTFDVRVVKKPKTRSPRGDKLQELLETLRTRAGRRSTGAKK